MTPLDIKQDLDFRAAADLPFGEEDLALLQFIETLQSKCGHPNGVSREDGCLDCGYYSK